MPAGPQRAPEGENAVDRDEHERTMAFADLALSQIRALRQPAEPRNFELWYHYATGYYPHLNKAINDMLALKGKLEPHDIEAILKTHVSGGRLSQEIDSFGAKVVDEIDQVMSMIDAAVGSTASYKESLADASTRLSQSKDRDGLRVIVESLVHTTKEIERSNQTLEARLRASKLEITELQQNLELARHESLTDPLTTLGNRKYFDQALIGAVATASATNEPLSLVMLDIDHFKAFNDTYGHLTGDQVLRLVANCIKQNVKGQDIAVRYGGEEFALILPATALRQAITVADHIRQAVVTKELMKRSTGESLGRITVSVGIAGWQKDDAAQTLIERADTCLYAAKHGGRNRVVCQSDPEMVSQRHDKVA
jgi:diguanylate cyclase